MTAARKKSLVILSGGIDSTTLLYKVKDQDDSDVFAITFDYNQKNKVEIEYAKKTCKKLNIKHKIVSLAALNELVSSSLTRDIDCKDKNIKNIVVPNCNMAFLSLATAYAIEVKAKEVYFGVHSEDSEIPDCRPEFIARMASAMESCDDEKIELKTPFIEMKKAEIIEIGLKLGVDYSKTWTCYNPKLSPCTKCMSCTDRLGAFKQNDKSDPLNDTL